MLERGAQGPVEWIAPVAFVAANIVIAMLVAGTLRAMIAGRLLPAPAIAAKGA